MQIVFKVSISGGIRGARGWHAGIYAEPIKHPVNIKAFQKSDIIVECAQKASVQQFYSLYMLSVPGSPSRQ